MFGAGLDDGLEVLGVCYFHVSVGEDAALKTPFGHVLDTAGDEFVGTVGVHFNIHDFKRDRIREIRAP